MSEVSLISDKTYSLYIPFTINPEMGFLNLKLGESKKIEILGHDFFIKRINDNLYILTISKFDTTEAARNFLPKGYSFLYWLSINQSIGLTYPRYIKDESLSMPLDEDVKLLFDQLRLDIEETGDNTNTIEVQNETRIIARGYDSVKISKFIDLDYIEDSFDISNPENVFNHEKLALAIELYSNYHFETTDNARFITLETVLEALIEDSKIPEVSLQAVNVLHKSLKEMRDKYSCDDEEWDDLDRLLNRVAKLKDEAIGNGMKIYIKEIIENHGELGNSVEVSNKLKKMYNNRSRLLHDGKIDEKIVKDNIQFLSDFVPKLLKVLYLSLVSA